MKPVKKRNTHAAAKLKKKAAPDADKVMASSLSAAAAMLECSARLLKNAKRSGAPGFRANGSVCISELKPWMEENAESLEENDKEALECRRILAQCEKLEYQNEVERRKYTHNDILREQGIRIGHATRTALLRLKSDAPTWEGLPADEIERRVEAQIESICADLHESIGKLYGSAGLN